MPVRIGATKNPEEQWFFDENDNWKIKTAYTSDQITQEYKDGKIKNNYVVADPKVLFAFDGGKIPNITADKNKFWKESGIIGKDGNFGDDYIQEPELRTTENGQFEYTFRPSKSADIAAVSTPFINATVSSYLKFPDQAKSLWDHVLNDFAPEGTELNYANGQVGTAFDDESSKAFSTAYSAWFFDDLNKKGGNTSNYKKIEKDEPTDAELRARRKEAKTTAEQKNKIEYLDKAYSIDNLRNLDQVKSIAKKEALKVEEFENSEDIEIGGKTISPGMSPGEIRKILLIASGIDAAKADEMAGEDLVPFGPQTQKPFGEFARK